MDPAIAASLLLARHKADVAMAFAARLQNMSPKASARLVEALNDSVDEMERIAADVATGSGEYLDLTV